MAAPPRRVLVVEDNRFVQIFYRTALRRAGYDVAVVDTGRDALPRALEFRPDLIILDLLLPDMQGKDVLRALKSSHETAAVPVVVVSSLAASDRVVQEGAVRCITKNHLTQEMLLSTVTEVLGAGVLEEEPGEDQAANREP